MMLRMALAGDCIVTRGAMLTADPRATELGDLIRSADFAFANLEVLPNDFRGYPARFPGGSHIAASQHVLDEVLAAGFDVVGCANNHALDFGVEGLLATIEALTTRGLPFAGIGRNLSQAGRPVYVDRPEGSLALISCSATFFPGGEASHQGYELQGRPGLNPLRHAMTLFVTTERMEALRAIDRETGLATRRTAWANLGLSPASTGDGQFSFLGRTFQVADEPGMVTSCHPGDLSEISAWVQDARQRADLVLVSVHCHEGGLTPEAPPDFLREFAHRMVDEGADAVVGHGPHFLRGLEVYEGKPIFYSLGNLAYQGDLVDQVPEEAYLGEVNLLSQHYGGDAMTPAAYFAAQSDQDRKLFAPHRKYWESVVPVLTFDGRALAAVELYPVTLGFGLPVHRRGHPSLADDQDANTILTAFTDLSAAYGTEIAIRQEGPVPTGQLRLAGVPAAGHQAARRAQDPDR
jgi:poly-gamma-glutamate capsule biosynthesis protein CapA/YwtB (metallophosphatase superfamily)